VGGLGCAQTIGSPIYSNVGQVGNIMGPYSVNQNSFPNGMVMNRGPGVFSPMYNGQIGVNPAFNGQVILGSNGNPMVTCFTAPCNVGGIGNSPVGVWNGGGGGYNSGYNQGSFTGIDVASICMANPMACQGINGGGWTGSSNPYALGPGGSSFYQLQEMNDQRRMQQARELQAQSYSLMSGISGYNGMGGGYFNGMGVGGFNLSAGISAGVRLPGLVPMASPLIGPGFPLPQSTTIGR
jgi:hypothetical protein